eukprot:137345_1
MTDAYQPVPLSIQSSDNAQEQKEKEEEKKSEYVTSDEEAIDISQNAAHENNTAEIGIEMETIYTNKNHNEDEEKQLFIEKSHIDEITLNGNIDNYQPTCPVILFEKNNHVFTIHCQKLSVSANCFISTAIVQLEGQWTNKTRDMLDCVFALPIYGTVVNVSWCINTGRTHAASFVSEENEATTTKNIIPEINPNEQYLSNLYRLSIGNVDPGNTISIKCEYIEPLDYFKKGYILSIPLFFSPGTVSDDFNWDQIVTVECKLNDLPLDTQIGCSTHNIERTEDVENETIIIVTKSCKHREKMTSMPNETNNISVEKTGRDFELYYNVKLEKTRVECRRKDDTICVFVTPPPILNITFGRAFYFLLDRSNSMMGEPYRVAIKAVNRALDRLRPSDQFNVGVIDHQAIYFFPSLVPANKEMLTNCKTWIRTYNPDENGNKINAAMNSAIDTAILALEQSDLLPFIIIFTAGNICNKNEICNKIEQNKLMRTRICTAGIGSFCDWFFLKTLSKISRGFCDIIVYQEKIYHQMDHLLRLCNTPVLTDIEIGIRADEVEIYPFPIPDLFIGSPFVIAIKYVSDVAPHKLILRGFNPHGDQTNFTTEVKQCDNLCLDKIFSHKQNEVEKWSDVYFDEISMTDELLNATDLKREARRHIRRIAVRGLILFFQMIGKWIQFLDVFTDAMLLYKASTNGLMIFTMLLSISILSPYILSYSSGIQLFLYNEIFNKITTLCSFKSLLLFLYLFPSGI